MKNLLLTIGLFLLIFIDAMGVAVIAPVLAPAFFTEPVQVLGQYSLPARQLIYGGLLSIFSWLTMYSSPLMGSLSDQVGRKLILNVCLLGIALSYLSLAFGVTCNSLLLLVLGRCVGGLTSGSQAVAQASILDNASSEKKNLYINMCLLVSSMGFFIGPMLAGYISNPQIVTWFHYDTPFYFVGLLALADMLLLYIASTKSTATIRQAAPVAAMKMIKGVDHLFDGFHNQKVRQLIILFAFMQMGWGAYFLFLPVYLVEKFHFNNIQTGSFMSVLGLGFCLTYGLISPALTKKTGPRATALLGLWGAAASILLLLCISYVPLFWLFGILSAIFICLGYSAVITLFLHTVPDERSGWVLGIAGATVSFSYGVITLIGGYLTTVSLKLPISMAVVCLLISGMLATSSSTNPATLPNPKEPGE